MRASAWTCGNCLAGGKRGKPAHRSPTMPALPAGFPPFPPPLGNRSAISTVPAGPATGLSPSLENGISYRASQRSGPRPCTRSSVAPDQGQRRFPERRRTVAVSGGTEQASCPRAAHRPRALRTPRPRPRPAHLGHATAHSPYPKPVGRPRGIVCPSAREAAPRKGRRCRFEVRSKPGSRATLAALACTRTGLPSVGRGLTSSFCVPRSAGCGQVLAARPSFSAGIPLGFPLLVCAL